MSRCPICRQTYTKNRAFQKCCTTPDCAVEMGRRIAAKATKAKDKERRDRLKTMSELRKDAQTAFNAFIRARDYGLPCISCGKHHAGQIHASHYRSVGSSPELRYDEKNVHAACSICNNHLSGNLIEYRIRLIERHGQSVVDYLEGPHDQKNYTREDLMEIKARYREKCREIEKCRD